MALESPQLSRRTLAKGSIWALPVVSGVAAAPAIAASRDPIATGTVCELFYGNGTVNYQTHNLYFGVKTVDPLTGLPVPIPKGTVVAWEVCVDPSTNPSGLNDWELPTREYPPGFNATSTSGPWYFSYETTAGAALAPGAPMTNKQCFVVKVTFSQPYAGGSFCAAIFWNDTYTLRPASTISISARGPIAGPVQSGGTGTLVYKTPKRHPTSINQAGRSPHYFQSKSGVQTCYPPTQWSVLLNNSGYDNVTCYPSNASIPSTARCTWSSTSCSTSTSGVCTPPSGGVLSGQTITNYC